MVDLRLSSRDPRTPGDDASMNGIGLMSESSSTRIPSPRKGAPRILPTPTSLSPSKSSSENRLPPSFEPTPQLPPAIPSRYSAGVYTPQSPYRPGEYQRSECAPSERTRIERKLFDDDEDLVTKNEPSSSSPLAPAFEAKMVLRNGASVDLISWLRTNFHHQPPPHSAVTPFMSLVHVQRLLQERFPRIPEPPELHRAVLAAFPHSEWEVTPDSKEPPIMRGLTWHGRDVAEEDDPDATPGRTRAVAPARGRLPRMDIDTAVPNGMHSGTTSRSPTQSPLMSPTSSSTRRAPPDTPARSVLDEFAEIATRTPVMKKERSLEAEPLPVPAGAYSLTTICNSTDRSWRKRPASQSPERRRRASTPDALQELLNAAEAVEGSPLNSVLSKHERGHKRRRTIAGHGPDFSFNRMAPMDARRARSVRGTASPQIAGLSLLSMRGEPMLVEDEDHEPVSPLASEESAASQLTSMHAPWHGRRGPVASSTTSQLSAISESVSSSLPGGVSSTGKGAGRKVNELPTSSQGQFPGVDCKPPYPYHEMIRYAIEDAPDRKLQLAQIYSSIADRFPFFKTLDEKKTAGWQNSIRHNLSLKKMFVRVNKADGSPDDTGGKGGWWTVQPGVPDEGRPGRKAKAKRQAEANGTGGDTASNSADGTPAPPAAASLPPTTPGAPSSALPPPLMHPVAPAVAPSQPRLAEGA